MDVLKRKSPSRLLAFLALPMLLVRATPFKAQTQENWDQPLQLVTRTDVDRNLFAMHMLHSVYANWPSLNSSPEELGNWFSAERQFVSAMTGTLRASDVDPQIVALYRDSLEMMSATQSYLDRLELIHEQSANQAPFDFLSSLFSGYQTGTQVEGTAKRFTSADNASTAGTMAGLYSAYSNYQQKTGARSASDTVAIQEETRRLQDRWSSSQSSLRATASLLTTKYRWNPGEAGFDGFSSPQYHDLLARSPRDPFLEAQYASAIDSSAKTGNDEVPAINAYWDAARLVPDDPAFSRLRDIFLARATEAAIRGAELDSGNTFARRSAFSGNAIRMARTYLSLRSSDSNGYAHFYLSEALAYAGRYPEAIRSAQDAYDLSGKGWERNSNFCVIYASLMSLSGDEQEAANWVVKAYHDGFTDVRLIKENGDFAPLRQLNPKRFLDITSPRVTYRVRYDTYPASVVLQNDSDFDLIKPTLTVKILKGDQILTKEVAFPDIQSGHSSEVDLGISVPGSSDDGEQATVNGANL